MNKYTVGVVNGNVSNCIQFNFSYSLFHFCVIYDSNLYPKSVSLNQTFWY